MKQRPIDTEVHSSRGDSRGRILEAIRVAEKACGVQFLAEHIGLHANTVRFHLDRLEADGLIHRQTRHAGEHGRPPLVYTAAAAPNVESDHRNFDQLAQVLAQLTAETNPDPVGSAIEVGQAWGRGLMGGSGGARSQQHAVTTLVETLTELGFAPEFSDDGEDSVVLHRHCPFLEVAQAHPDVVCSVHLGLMRGVLSELETSVAVKRLVPFAGPSSCDAYLRGATKQFHPAETAWT